MSEFDPDRIIEGELLPDVDGDGEADLDHVDDPAPARRAPWARRRDRDVTVDEPDPPAPVRLPAQLVRAADHHVPTPRRAVAVTREYAPVTARALAWSPLTLPWWLLRQLGHAYRGLDRVLDARAAWIADPEQRAALRAEGIDPTEAARLRDKAVERSGNRRRTSATLTGVALFLAASLFVVSWQAGLALLGMVLVLLVVKGRRPAPDAGAPEVQVRVGPIRPGMTLRSVADSVQGIALVMGIDDLLVQQPRPFVDGEGFDMRVQTSDPLVADTLREFERRLRVPHGSIAVVTDPGDSSIRDLRITLLDPLETMSGRTEPEFDAASVREPALLGKVSNGRRYDEVFAGSHVQLIGKSRSGKSSALWRICRLIASWYDATAVGIDVTRGPAFTAVRGVLDDVAFDYDGAVRLLREARDEAQDRIDTLARRAESDDPADDEADENHTPTIEQPQRFVMIDELNALVTMSRLAAAEAGNRAGLGEAVELIEWLLRYGGKARVNLVLSGQSSKGSDYGTTTIRDQITIAIVFACAREDVLRVLGKDARDDGWRPDRLRPAQDTEVRDAGKCYTLSARNGDPLARRVFRYSQGEVRRFAREYRAYRGIGGGTAPVDAVVIPAPLAQLAALFAELRVDRIPSEVVATRLGITQVEVAEQLAEFGLSTRRLRSPLADGRQVACYDRGALDRAIGRHS